MANGWARDGAVQDQVDASVEEAIELVRSRLPEGEGATHCDDCSAKIPEARRAALPGVRLCVLNMMRPKWRYPITTGVAVKIVN